MITGLLPLFLYSQLKRVYRSLLSCNSHPYLLKQSNEPIPRRNILTKEIELWRCFADSLKSEMNKKLFLEMLEKCRKYALAINLKENHFPT
jgi:hypothetical protein